MLSLLEYSFTRFVRANTFVTIPVREAVMMWDIDIGSVGDRDQHTLYSRRASCASETLCICWLYLPIAQSLDYSTEAENPVLYVRSQRLRLVV